jgi:preprotein translocase subunit SecD
MTRKNVILLLLILIIFGFTLWAILPIDADRFGREGLHLGLDLVGGVYLVYQADFTQNSTAEDQTADIERALITIEKRIDKYGVTEPIIQQMGEDRIMVQLPGFTDIDAAKRLVEQTGFLEFREAELNAQGEPVYLKDYLEETQLEFFDNEEIGDRIFAVSVTTKEGKPEYKTVAIMTRDGSGTIRFTDASGEPIEKEALQEYGDSVAWIPARGDDGTQLTGDLLADAQPTISQGISPQPEVSIKWDSQGSIIFDQIAKRLYSATGDYSPKYALGIVLDNTMLSAPRINSPKFEGSGVITGNFNRVEAEELANLLKSGSLPIPLKKPPLYQEKVSATLGANFIHMSWIAGLIGIALVMLFIVVYYRLPGLLASLALIFYGTLILAIFKLWPVTLSLAGLGGFIVSIGMAVDANVLIFERMKEEMRGGRTLGAAIETGFKRAWTAILDSNITTIIACLILIWLGSSVIASAQVMGFAITLLIGVVVSMFTAIVVTRTLLRLFVGTGLGKLTNLFSIDWGKK